MSVKRIDNSDAVRKLFDGLNGGEVGFISGQGGENIYPGTGHTVASNAAVHEFGSGKIPPRPFFRQGVDLFVGKQNKVVELLKRDNGNELTLALFAQTVRESIRSGNFAPNSKQTIEEKGSSKPLIDTGLLVNSVSYKEHQ